MTVGFLANKNAIDSQAGGLVVAVRDSLYRRSQFCAWLQSTQQADANLIALGYTQGEVTTLEGRVHRPGRHREQPVPDLARAGVRRVEQRLLFQRPTIDRVRLTASPLLAVRR